MKEKGIVQTTSDGEAVVVITRHSACNKCDRDCGLSKNGHESEQMEVEVIDPIGTSPGDEVTVEMEANRLHFASFMIYLFPIMAMLLGYFIFSWLAGIAAIASVEPVGIFGSALFFVLVWIIINRVDSYFAGDRSFKSRIVGRKSSPPRSSYRNYDFNPEQ